MKGLCTGLSQARRRLLTDCSRLWETSMRENLAKVEFAICLTSKKKPKNQLCRVERATAPTGGVRGDAKLSATTLTANQFVGVKTTRDLCACGRLDHASMANVQVECPTLQLFVNSEWVLVRKNERSAC
eukprot:m.80264 g.80264  ORF g.80264 m.80264 type:complete len:129 (-) comp10888_c0_seq1:367-753(-)